MRSFKFFCILSTLISLISCNKDQDFSNKPSSLEYYEIFKGQSVFYNPISDNPETDPNSSVMTGSLVEQQESQGFLIAVKEWTVSVFYAGADTPREDVKLTAYWAPKKKLLNVPLPEFSEPDPSGDGSMVIIDTINGCVYDFWQMKYTSRGWKASWGNALPLSGDGIFSKGLSARGSGFELLQGVIWPHELERGEINHALIFSYDHTKSGGPVSPATESDGTSPDDWAIPEGALVQLDPALDLNSLGLNSYEMTIAKALQVYGMYLCDDGGGIQLYAVNPVSCKNNPYENIWGDQTYISLNKIPADRFRILKLPPQSDGEVAIVANSCAEFE